MKTLFFSLTLLLAATTLFSQVGIGTVSPNAELDVASVDTGIPALRLRPQTNPTGSTTGELSVIGEELFMYDATRSKWLSVETAAIKWIYHDPGQSIDHGYPSGIQLDFAAGYEAVIDDIGAVMPFDGTIVYASISYKQGSGGEKEFDIYIEDAITETSTFGCSVETSDFKGSDTSLNVDFNKRDIIRVWLGDGGAIKAPIVTLWVRRRS